MENITVRQIEEKDRLAFLPAKLGRLCLGFEGLVYNFMGQYVQGYSGGYWEFYALSNGGFYIALESDERMRVINPENYTDEDMSAQAASIGVCLYALNALAWKSRSERVIDIYDALRAYAAQHPEGSKIMRFID